MDSSIVKTVSKLLNDKRKEPVEGSSNLFTINPTNPQQVQMKGSAMTFQFGYTYNLNHTDLSFIIIITQLNKRPENEYLIHTFLLDL